MPAAVPYLLCLLLEALLGLLGCSLEVLVDVSLEVLQPTDDRHDALVLTHPPTHRTATQHNTYPSPPVLSLAGLAWVKGDAVAGWLPRTFMALASSSISCFFSWLVSCSRFCSPTENQTARHSQGKKPAALLLLLLHKLHQGAPPSLLTATHLLHSFLPHEPQHVQPGPPADDEVAGLALHTPPTPHQPPQQQQHIQLSASPLPAWLSYAIAL